MRVAVLVLVTGILSACVNEAGNLQRYQVFRVTPEQFAEARQQRQPFIINNRGYIQTIQSIDFYTRQWGKVRILPNFVSDGSSLPFDDDPGSNMAALLHDALYRAAPELTFPHGFPGRWTRAQADEAYCLQLRRQGAHERLSKLNCRGVKVIGISQGVWHYHRHRREAYWRAQENGKRMDTAR